jgi:hypothetical protein
VASNLRRSKRTVGKRISYLESRLKATRLTPIPRRLSPSAVKPKNIQAGAVTAIAIAPGSITNDALAVGVGGASTAYSGTAPSSPSVGDVWFDSSDSLKLKRWDGTAWVSMQDLGIAAAAAGAAAAATAATAAQTTANGKNKVFYAASAPTAVSVGDLWFDTAQENKLSKWNGSAWEAFGLGNAAFSNIDAGKITAGTIAADRITSTSISAANITAAQITSGTISSARITSASISAADINADRITAGTITGRAIVGGTFTTGTWSAGLGTGLRIDSDGYITGSGAGVKIRDYGSNGTDGATGTVLFGNIIGTGRLDADRVLLGDGTSSIELLKSLVNFKRYTDDTGGVVNIYRRSWTADGDSNNGTSLADYAALIAFYKEGAGSATSAIRWRSYTSSTIPTTGPAQVVLDNFQTNVWSDARLKQEVSTPESALEIVKKLNPKSFSWKNDSTSTPYYGMFAQEMYEVLPNLVTVGSAGDSAPVNSATGEHIPEDVWSVDYVSLVPYLIGAVKELSAKVAELEAKK